MNTATIKRVWVRTGLGCLLALLVGGAPQAQDINASSFGRIEALSLETGQMVIQGRLYNLDMSDLTVVHEERVLDPDVLRLGMDVAFAVGRSSAGGDAVVRSVKILNQSAALGQDD